MVVKLKAPAARESLLEAAYAIEVSTDLKIWTRVGKAERNEHRISFSDRRAQRCFYRAVRISTPTSISE